MLEFIMEQNVLLYLLAAACVVGAASQLVLKQLYDRLIRDTKKYRGAGRQISAAAQAEISVLCSFKRKSRGCVRAHPEKYHGIPVLGHESSPVEAVWNRLSDGKPFCAPSRERWRFGRTARLW